MTAAKAKAQKRRQNEKNKKKLIARKINSQKLGFIILFSLGLIVSLTLVNLWGNIEKIRDKDAKIAAMEQEYNHLRIQNEAKKQKLEELVDEGYITEVAKENGYRRNDEIIFYLSDKNN